VSLAMRRAWWSFAVLAVVAGCGDSHDGSHGGGSGKGSGGKRANAAGGGGSGGTTRAGSAGTSGTAAGHSGSSATGALGGSGGTSAVGGDAGSDDGGAGMHTALGGTGATGGSTAGTTDDLGGAGVNAGGHTCYLDLDLDGYAVSVVSDDLDCDDHGESSEEPAGWDCDDTNPFRRDLRKGHVDRDGDGFGTGPELDVCSGAFLPSGYSASSDDCNDDDPTVWPGQSDTPGDGIDQDCDQIDPPLDAAHAVFVDAACTGSCGAGTPSSPVTSLADALALATGDQVLVLAQGTYAGRLTTSHSILGGYVAGSWERDIEAYPTTIAASDLYGIPLVGIDDDATVVLSGLTLSFLGDGAKSGISIYHASATLDHVSLTLSTTSRTSLSAVSSWGERLVVVQSSIAVGDATAYLSGSGGEVSGIFYGGQGAVVVRDSSITTGAGGLPAPGGSALTLQSGLPDATEQRALIEGTSISSSNSGVYAPIVYVSGSWVDLDAPHPLPSSSLRFFRNDTHASLDNWGIRVFADLEFVGNEVHAGNTCLASEVGTVVNNVFWPGGDALAAGRALKLFHNTIHATTNFGVIGQSALAILGNNIFSGVRYPVWITDEGGPARIMAYGNDFFGGEGYPVNDAAGVSAVDDCAWHGCWDARGNLGVDPELDFDGIHLSAPSALRDVGVSLERFVGAPLDDIDGTARDTHPDIGADELDASR
jgi:hypothetical protein